MKDSSATVVEVPVTKEADDGGEEIEVLVTLAEVVTKGEMVCVTCTEEDSRASNLFFAGRRFTWTLGEESLAKTSSSSTSISSLTFDLGAEGNSSPVDLYNGKVFFSRLVPDLLVTSGVFLERRKVTLMGGEEIDSFPVILGTLEGDPCRVGEAGRETESRFLVLDGGVMTATSGGSFEEEGVALYGVPRSVRM